MPELSVEQVRARLEAVQDIEITDATPDKGQHYGYVLGVGDNELKTLWFCTDNRTHPDHDKEIGRGVDPVDLYYGGHYASVDDEAAFAFLLNAKSDMAFTLSEVARYAAERDALRAALEWYVATLKTGGVEINTNDEVEWITAPALQALAQPQAPPDPARLAIAQATELAALRGRVAELEKGLRGRAKFARTMDTDYTEGSSNGLNFAADELNALLNTEAPK